MAALVGGLFEPFDFGHTKPHPINNTDGHYFFTIQHAVYHIHHHEVFSH